MHKIIAVDFDGTLCDSSFPDVGPMISGACEALKCFRALGYKIIIHSCRTCHWKYDIFGGSREIPTLERPSAKNMIQFLNENDIPYDEIDDGSKGKPVADYYIDDKGIRFSNNWSEIAELITSLHENSRAV